MAGTGARLTPPDPEPPATDVREGLGGAGAARVHGFDVADTSGDVRCHIGLVCQDPTLDGYLTAEQNLRLHADLGVAITSVAVSRPTLDDVFMRYTGLTMRDAETASSSDRDRAILRVLARSGR